MQASLMRVISPKTVCVLVNERVMIQADLCNPLSPRTHGELRGVNSLKPLAARVQLGQYDLDRHRFTGCTLHAEAPEIKYERVQYASKSNNKKMC
jgi:hypothetical protein